jgi:diguanylate cyclase (GGDEF)-like protein
VLNRQTRSTDIVARLGGDEFAILLIGCSLPRGNAIAESIRRGIAQIELEGIAPLEDQTTLVTASIGLRSLNSAQQQSFEATFQQVDRLLYASKRLGRDRVTLNADETEQSLQEATSG